MPSLLTELLLKDAEEVNKFSIDQPRDALGRWGASAAGVKQFYRIRYGGAKTPKEHATASKFHRNMERAFATAALASRLLGPEATIPLTIAAGLHKLAADAHERKSHA